jgi:hypothetical protein
MPASTATARMDEMSTPSEITVNVVRKYRDDGKLAVTVLFEDAPRTVTIESSWGELPGDDAWYGGIARAALDLEHAS